MRAIPLTKKFPWRCEMKLIVAVDKNWAIGHGGELLARIPADLKRFKEITLGHPVLLGRKTLATFPGGKPLPGRENFILSSTPGYAVEGAKVLASAEEAGRHCPDDTFVIGGGTVYRAMLNRCDAAYVTKIHAGFAADTWFPDLDALPDWALTGEEPPLVYKGLTFQYLTYERVR